MLFWTSLRGLMGIFAAGGVLTGRYLDRWVRLRERQREAAEDPWPYTQPPGFFHEFGLAAFGGTLLSAGALGVGLYFYAWGYAGSILLSQRAPTAGGSGALTQIGEALASSGLGLSGNLATQYILLVGGCSYTYITLVDSMGSFFAFGDFTAYCVLFSTLLFASTFRKFGPKLR